MSAGAAVKVSHKNRYKPAVYPGGEDAMYAYIAKNIQYPAFAKEADIQGTVLVHFFVDEDGRTDNITVLRDIGGGCGEEVKKVIAAMHLWQPAMAGKKRVKAVLTLPVEFSVSR